MSAKAREDTAGQGFVLVEILVALSVVAVMSALMAGFFGQLSSLSNVKEQVLAQAELAAAVSHLDRTLSATRPAPLADNEEGTNFQFDGRGQEMRFAALTRQGFYSLALRDIHVYVDQGGAGVRLVQTHVPRRPESTDTLPPPVVVIVDDIDAVSFEYSDDGISYTTTWKIDGTLPRMVRMTIVRGVAGKQISASAIARVL